MKRINLVHLLFIVILAGAAGTTALCQTAQVTGRISDQTGAVVPGAQITVTNISTGLNRETESNSEGFFTIPLLKPGEYRVAVKKDGFKPLVQSGVTLQVEQVARLDYTLETGALTEVVNVAAGAIAALETETSSLGKVVDQPRVVQFALKLIY